MAATTKMECADTHLRGTLRHNRFTGCATQPAHTAAISRGITLACLAALASAQETDDDDDEWNQKFNDDMARQAKKDEQAKDAAAEAAEAAASGAGAGAQALVPHRGVAAASDVTSFTALRKQRRPDGGVSHQCAPATRECLWVAPRVFWHEISRQRCFTLTPCICCCFVA